MCSAAAVGLWATQADAQTAPATTAPGTTGGEVSEVIVTGSRIPQPNLTSVSPVTMVTNKDIKLSGINRTEDLINQLPQAFSDQGSGVSNGGTGTASVSLRNMGPQRTLILIDGRRVLPGNPGYTGNPPVVDLKFIPTQLIERIDVLTGGASAVYGSDAVAGVVNFVMKKDFEGVQVDSQYSIYQHDNDDSTIQGLERSKGYPYPSGSTWDGKQFSFNLMMGINSPDGKGNATAYFSYLSIAAINQSQRDYSACTLSETATGFTCAGSGTTFPAHFVDLNGKGYIVDKTTGNTVRAYSSATDTYNFAPLNYYQLPDTRYSAGVVSHYDISKELQLYAQLMFMDDFTSTQAAPSGIFGNPFVLNCDNAMWSPQERATFCPGNATSTTLAILRRNVEGGGRIDNLRHDDYRILIGAKGNLGEHWTYDVYGQFGASIFQENFQNDVSMSHVAQALNVVRGPDGSLQCADAAAVAAGCVPYNIFAAAPVSAAALRYISIPAFQEGTTSQAVVSASASGELGGYGIKSPMATDGVGVAFGAEYRREAVDLRVDNEYLIGDLSGQGGVRLPFGGSFDVYELFGEARVPLVQDAPLVHDLTLELGYRFSDYSTSGTTDTYKVGGDWSLTPDFKLRASYNRAVRAPNALELYAGLGVALDPSISADPCEGESPSATFQQCARTGVTQAQYGHIPANSAAQYNGLTGGNPSLTPEVADTFSAGFVWRPRSLGAWLEPLTVTADWYDIKVKNVINPVGAGLIMNQCLQTGDPTFCSLIHRSPEIGDLWLGQSGYVTDIQQNEGSLENSGVDTEVNYQLDLAKFGWDSGGHINFNLVGTYVEKYITQPVPFLPGKYDCAGLYGSLCTIPLPKWRHKLRATWETPWNFDLSGQWRYIGSVKAQQTSSNPLLTGDTFPADAEIKGQSYFDLSGTWRVKDSVTIRAGVNNIFDKEPPLIGQNVLPGVFGNGNTYPEVWDSLGRYVFVGLSADF
jgi:outer membrane receptor protein involved in Fe transport